MNKVDIITAIKKKDTQKQLYVLFIILLIYNKC